VKDLRGIPSSSAPAGCGTPEYGVVSFVGDASEIQTSSARHSQKSAPLTQWQVRKIRNFIDANLQSRVSVEELADVVGFSRCYFSRSFRLSFSCSPAAFVLKLRIQRVQELILCVDLPLVLLATTCGFRDQAHLSRAFKRVTGVPPSIWRRMNMPKPGSVFAESVKPTPSSGSPTAFPQAHGSAIAEGRATSAQKAILTDCPAATRRAGAERHLPDSSLAFDALTDNPSIDQSSQQVVAHC
jgi:AraC-like DNA-binding protein